MTRVVARVLVSFLIIPLGLIGVVLLAFLLTQVARFDEETVFPVLFAAASIGYPMVYWLLWRPLVPWTPRRARRTGVITIFALVLAVVALLGVPALARWNDASFIMVLVHCGLALAWTCACTWVWMESPRERLERGARAAASNLSRSCPACRYDMSGLKGLTCPECGLSYTVDQFLTEQRTASHPPSLDA